MIDAKITFYRSPIRGIKGAISTKCGRRLDFSGRYMFKVREGDTEVVRCVKAPGLWNALLCHSIVYYGPDNGEVLSCNEGKFYVGGKAVLPAEERIARRIVYNEAGFEIEVDDLKGVYRFTTQERSFYTVVALSIASIYVLAQQSG